MDNSSSNSSPPLACQECGRPTHDGETVLCDTCWDRKNYDVAWGPMVERRKAREAEIKAAPPATKPAGHIGQATPQGTQDEASTQAEGETALLKWLLRETAVQIAAIEDAITKASECEDRAGVEFLRGRYAQVDGLAVLVDACLQCEPSQWPWRS